MLTPAEAVEESDVIVILAPDHVQRKLYAESVEPHITPGDTLVFGHGFNIRFGYITPPEGVDVIMVAPKGPGHLVRREYVDGRGVPVLVAVEKDASGKAWDLALAYAKAIGGLRAGGIRTTFTEETETDLFGEQAVLCGGASQLVMYGFEVLTEAGYQPEVAYFECLHELKLIVDLMYEGGIAKQRWSVSDTAEYGDYVSGPLVIDEHVKDNMKAVLENIQNGSFAQRFIDDQDAGAPGVQGAAGQGRAAPDRETGRELRKLMSWVKSTTATTSRAPRRAEGHPIAEVTQQEAAQEPQAPGPRGCRCVQVTTSWVRLPARNRRSLATWACSSVERVQVVEQSADGVEARARRHRHAAGQRAEGHAGRALEGRGGPSSGEHAALEQDARREVLGQDHSATRQGSLPAGVDEQADEGALAAVDEAREPVPRGGARGGALDAQVASVAAGDGTARRRWRSGRPGWWGDQSLPPTTGPSSGGWCSAGRRPAGRRTASRSQWRWIRTRRW